MSFFKAYDMRGVFGTDFDLDTVYRIGRWLPTVVPAKRWLVGRDARLSSPEIRDALCRGLTESGCDVDDMGLATTPMVYFFTAGKGYDGSVQITASHNPPDCNGMKVSKTGALPVGYATGLAELERRVNSGELPPPSPAQGRVRTVDYTPVFTAWLRPRVGDLTGLRFAVDCSDGAAGLVIRDVLGNAPVYLNDTPNGSFPHHAPNPLEIANDAQLMGVVKANRLDLGVIFDGDADRAMFIDETGAFIPPDLLIPVIAKPFLLREPGATVIHDVRTSRGVIETLREMGARPLMGKVGHAFAKVLLRESHAVCGGELAGHYYFRDFVNCDSGELATILVLNAAAEAKRAGRTFSQLIAPIRRYANSGEINFRIAEKALAITAARSALATALGAPDSVSTLDGVRIEYPDGWVCLRQSNTEPYLRLIAEFRAPAKLEAVLACIRRSLGPFLSDKPHA